MKKGKENIKAKSIVKRCRVAALLLIMTVIFTVPAYATGPVQALSNLESLMFDIVRVLGGIILIWGIVQVGLSFQSHDPSQRSQGFLWLVGGLIIFFAKDILSLISGG